MTQVVNTPPHGRGLPGWVPDAARHYVSHVEMGQPIRALARSAECHASTILRQIRRLETRRDDPLVDDALDHAHLVYARKCFEGDLEPREEEGTPSESGFAPGRKVVVDARDGGGENEGIAG